MGMTKSAAAVLCLLLAAVPAALAQFHEAREVVGRAQEDLRRAEHFAHADGKEKERYQNAQRHLSEFDRELSRGKFDKDKLDGAIDDVKNVVDSNTLTPQARDALSNDLAELRHLRETRGRD